jgi:hypothetical protein
MIDGASLIIGRLIVWWAISIAAVMAIAVVAGICRDIVLKLKHRLRRYHG